MLAPRFLYYIQKGGPECPSPDPGEVEIVVLVGLSVAPERVKQNWCESRAQITPVEMLAPVLARSFEFEAAWSEAIQAARPCVRSLPCLELGFPLADPGSWIGLRPAPTPRTGPLKIICPVS